MPTLSSSNRSQLAYKLEGLYPTNFGVLQGGNGQRLGMLSETLSYDIENVQSKLLREDRQVPDIVQVGAQAAGGFGFEQIYAAYDVFIQAALQGDYTVYGTNGVSTTLFDFTNTSTTLTAGVASSGADIFTGLHAGQWFTIIPDAAESDAVKEYLKRRAFRVSASVAPSSTVITLDAATPINATLVPSLSDARIASARAYNGNTMRSYSLEVAHADITQFRVYTGMVLSKMDVKLSVGSIVTGSFEFMGKTMIRQGATGMGTAVDAPNYTPANATRGVFDMFENGVSISASTYIKNGEFSIDNSLRMQDAIGVFGAAGIGVGTMQVRGKLMVYFADGAVYDRFLAGTASSLSIPVLDVDGNGYVYHFPRIKYTATKVNAGGQDQDNMLEMDFQALPSTTAGPLLNKSVAIYRCGAAVTP